MKTNSSLQDKAFCIETKAEIFENLLEVSQNAPTFKTILDTSSSEAINNGDLDGIPETIPGGIDEVRSEKSKRNRYSIIASPLAAIAIVVLIVIAVALFTNGARNNKSLVISEEEIPLNTWDVTERYENKLQGRVYYEDGRLYDGVEGVELILLSWDGGVYERVYTQYDGSFIFDGFSDGIYRLIATIPNDKDLAFSENGSLSRVVWVMVDGETDLVFEKDGTRKIEGVSIPIGITD